MKISLKWLNLYVDVADFFEKPDELSKILTAAGLEVEGVENQAEQFKNVVVAQVDVLGKHPNADKLTLCDVNIGSGVQKIVCGAKNHKQGDKVVAALPGAVLPGDFKIKKSKIRGEESLGMLCSEKELGLSEESEGIIILPEDAPVGTPIAEYKGLDDVLFELSVTPNRADCLSHVGLARELSCLLDRPLTLPDLEFGKSSGSTKDMMAIEIKDSEHCPRYAGRSVFGVKVGESPAWLKSKLESVGMNSINNVVDVTNYVMLELGQPLHAFDAANVKGSKITVALSTAGETFQTLDGTEIKLSGDELTIRDQERPVALAGVVGGLNSGVTESTKDIFLEAAYFTQGSVRKTSRKHGIDTDSGYRFSRGVDPQGTLTAMDRACKLIQEVAGGEVAKDFLDECPKEIPVPEIEVSIDYVEQRLGYKVESKDFESWMSRLGCEKLSAKSGNYKFKTPSFRADLSRDVDLVEEYARLYGYEHIPEKLPKLVEEPTPHNNQYYSEQLLVDRVHSQGYLQAVNYNFISDRFQRSFLGKTDTQSAIIANPLSEELNAMRLSLLPGLFENLVHNIRHGQSYGRLFELGTVFEKTAEGYSENQKLGFMVWGQKNLAWQKEDKRPVIFDLKTAVENLLTSLNATSWQWRDIEAPPVYMHPAQCSDLFFEGKVVGRIGSLHPQLAADNKLRESIALGELDVAALTRNQPRKPKLKVVSKFPSVDRDLTFVLPESVTVHQVSQLIAKAAGNLLTDLNVVDVFTGDKLGEGLRAVSFRLTCQSQEQTLDEKSLTELQSSIVNKVTSKLDVTLR